MLPSIHAPDIFLIVTLVHMDANNIYKSFKGGQNIIPAGEIIFSSC